MTYKELFEGWNCRDGYANHTLYINCYRPDKLSTVAEILQSNKIAFSAQLDGKYWAGTMTVGSDDNVMNISRRISGMQAANLCATRKAAEELADCWNECFKRNGTSIFTEGIA